MIDTSVSVVGSDDRTLLGRIANGDDLALRELHDRHAPWLLSRLQRRCHDDDVVFEAVQDTFIAVWRNPDGWNGTGEIPAWIWGIAIRRLVGVHRGRNRWIPVVSETVVSEAGPDVAAFDLADRDELATALGALNPDLQAAVRATYLDGLSITEASSLLGIPVGTVKTRVMRAKAQLRGALR